MKKYELVLSIFVVSCLLLVVSQIGCASIKNYLTGSTTSLTSNSLAAASAMRAMGITINGTQEGSNWCITPTKISGKVMSVVLPVEGVEDEGIVPFGSGRPDIAPANSVLYDFDLSQTTMLHADIIGIKPGFRGGRSEQILMLFGYFDVEFDHNGSSKKIRFVYGDTNPYVRGDKLLYNANGATDGKYYWYNTSAETFVSESLARPASPCANSYVRDFSDPVRPQLHYYMLGAQLRNCLDYDGARRNYITLNKSIIEDRDQYFTVDFDILNAVIFRNVTSAEFNSLTNAQLIEKFDMKQNASRWQSSELYCAISYEARTKF